MPGFMKAWRTFKNTHEGKRLIASLEKSGWTVHIRASQVGVRDGKVGQWTTALGQQYTGPTEGRNLGATEAAALINIEEHVKAFRTKEQLIMELADTIHHELRHAEADIYKPVTDFIERLLQPLGLDGRNDTNRETHQKLDQYNTPNDDPFNADFQREIGKVR